MQIDRLLKKIGSNFYVGVPDSQLRALCDYLSDSFDEKSHIIAPNEGACVGLAAGYHLATGKVPLVYMQNSGQGNALNPAVSLTHELVYAIPVMYIIGWRGQPGFHDEPQHIHQGDITLSLLESVGIEYFVIEKTTDETAVFNALDKFNTLLQSGKSVAFVIGKGALEYEKKVKYKNDYTMNREFAIGKLLEVSQNDTIISTTGKTSRELFELRELRGENHERDFLTVGSMGHSLAIAFSVAQQKPNKKIWCIDGDGAALMHMGTMALVGSSNVHNLVHVLINNEAHESVGGMTTIAKKLNFVEIAKALGYKNCVSVQTSDELKCALKNAKQSDCLTFVEVKVAIGSRDDLGRPTVSPIDNKKDLMAHLQNSEVN